MILLPILTSTVLHKPINVGNVSAIKVSFLMPPIRHNQINSSLSHTFHRIHTALELSAGYPTDFENNVGFTLFLLLL